ncbi:hypothetical protein J5T34_01270 [Cupriavidus gilardii]|uniref:hypothetical protein n=1 Tax=Cupriavidus gilardii TaxID=82541 RepID=UPI001ABED2B1|nr:hypothetical protein [Cupriavidus gilardii]MBO4119364.1 hypothetical protein [Cupriavidus gilardii]
MRTDWLRALRRRGTDRRTGALWAVWLVLCLLLAQHAGLVHRVQHGGYGGAATGRVSTGRTLQALPATATAARDHASLADTVAAADTNTDGHAPDSPRLLTHSCVLFDAATQAAGACGAPPMPLLSHGKPLVPPGITWRWPHLPPQRSFLTRAPPSSLAFA